ncbi:MAG: radical SAM protein [Bacteroidaceae bacterium]|nr:radical SAM protein [Prevotellaceae bacterium]MDY5632724.1 radical SAM protein [Bacteroidaceae bacterium]
MSTVIYPSPIFGPVHSRRLGVSLGINLLPADGKWCSFDCIYCECGLNKERRAHQPLPTREEVRNALEARLKQMQQEGPKPDVLTFAGNGEPTLHPAFPEIIEDVRHLRDQYFPEAQISVLSNSTQILRPRVLEALVQHADNPIMKLDTVSEEYIRQVDQPQGHFNVEDIIQALSAVGQRIIIQTMFMNGTYNGKDISNVGEEFVSPWLKALERIRPRQVMIYTIDRETPVSTLKKATADELDTIAARVQKELNIPCSVSY